MARPLNILSIQSHVAYGHVGNASAVFPMQRMGCEVWPIHTVQFSNHTGYAEGWSGRVYDGQMIDEVVSGIARLGKLKDCDGVLSGYMGSSDIGHAILAAVARVRRRGILLRSRDRRCRQGHLRALRRAGIRQGPCGACG
jgi:pyridoxine kinase